MKGIEEQPSYIISIETGGKHFYVEKLVTVSGLAVLRHFPDKKSEPRLRVETRGTLSFLAGKSKQSLFEESLTSCILLQQLYKLRPTPRMPSNMWPTMYPCPKRTYPINTKFKLEGPIGSTEFFEQISAKMQNFGEGQGWVKDGHLYWRKGNNADNYVAVDGLMIEGGEAWMHSPCCLGTFTNKSR